MIRQPVMKAGGPPRCIRRCAGVVQPSALAAPPNRPRAPTLNSQGWRRSG
jgi:hypothetical protein